MAAEKLVIEHLHAHSCGRQAAANGAANDPAAGNPVALKLGLEQALRQVRLRPAHLPPQAILVIRTLASRSTFGLSAVEMQRWQQQVETQIDELARQALRPGRQHVPLQANSVLFDDEVELLLCYTRDLLAGRSAWYWSEMFPAAARPSQPFGRRLLTAWLAHPQAIPNTLVALRPPEVTATLGRLDRSELSRLAHCLHETYALPRGALDAAGPEPARPRNRYEQPPAAIPWREWLPPQQLRGLAPPAAYLLGLSHALVRRPQQARRPEFGQQARRWLEAVASAAASSSVIPERHLSPDTAGPAGPALGSPLPERHLSPDTAPPAGLALGSPMPERHLSPDTAPPAALVAVPAGRTPAPSSPISPSENLRPAAGDLATGLPEVDILAPNGLATGSFTRLGGTIHFVNLMIRLGLPEAIPALAGLNPWELLGGLIAGLLGRQLDGYKADPLWAILSELAGLEPGQPWGASLPAPNAFRLPAAWLALLPPLRVIAHQDPASSRLRLWASDPGYLIADLPAGTAPEEWGIPEQNIEFLDSLAEWPNLTFGDGWSNLAGQLLSPSLGWWIRRLQPFLSQLLAQLIGDPAAAVDTLFHQPATLYLSRTHVDLLLSIEQISIPLRRAGLDQTPGWRAEFGFIISIHFE